MTKAEILQVKITLEGVSPRIWRRFLVENTFTFHQLHQAIQIVMGWNDSHLYGFEVDQKAYQDARHNDFTDFNDGKHSPSHKTMIKELKAKQKFYYTYDFGDNWEHQLVVEKVLPKDISKRYPVCVGGERNCPPEDSGSISGYHHLMSVRKNKKHPEYKELVIEWLGEDYNPEHFSIPGTNIGLQRAFPKKGEKIDGRARYWVFNAN